MQMAPIYKLFRLSILPMPFLSVVQFLKQDQDYFLTLTKAKFNHIRSGVLLLRATFTNESFNPNHVSMALLNLKLPLITFKASCYTRSSPWSSQLTLENLLSNLVQTWLGMSLATNTVSLSIRHNVPAGLIIKTITLYSLSRTCKIFHTTIMRQDYSSYHVLAYSWLVHTVMSPR